MTRRFTIEIRDYDPGSDDIDITTGRIERAVQKMLERDESDGIVIVTEQEGGE